MAFDKGARLDLTLDQVKELVNQLPKRERVQIARDIAREDLVKEFKELIRSFRTDELDEATIRKEVELVRARRYAERQKQAGRATGRH